MIEITLRVEDVDYDSLADLLLPALVEKLEGDSLGRFLVRSPEAAQAAARKLLDHMSQQQRDALLVRFLSQNREKGAQALEDMAAQNGVRLKIRELNAQIV